MTNVIEREIIFRTLAGSPVARRIAERVVAIEDEEESRTTTTLKLKDPESAF